MENNIRVIGLDLDGTLLQRDRTISEENKKAIRECLDKGIQVFLVTGRPYCFAKMIAHLVDDRIKVIAGNGGIYEIGNRCIETAIDAEALKEIVSVLQKYQMHAFLKGKRFIYTQESYDERFLYDHMNECFQDDYKIKSYTQIPWDELAVIAKDVLKILVYHKEEHLLEQARNEIECIENCEITDYQKISFDITAKGIHKGNIIRTVLKENGFTKDNFMAIGDGNNDIPMFEEASIAVAMGNAKEEVKIHSSYVTAHYLEDGVSKAIHHFINI